MSPVDTQAPTFTALPVAPALLGESPLWHPDEQRLYWVDIPGRQLHRFDPASGAHQAWPLPAEPGCCAALDGGGLALAMRDGLWRFDTATGARTPIAPPPYDPAAQRFNDGKADPQGRWWIGALDDARRPQAALYRHAGGRTERLVDGLTTGNGLAFAPDGRTVYWADTKAHTVYAADHGAGDGPPTGVRVFARFTPRADGQPLATYGGRPDGAAVDAEGGYWVAMFEGQRLLRFAPDGTLTADWPLPVRCPTMPCFGGPDLRTLYLTTARDKRPADERAAQPLAGAVLSCRVEVPGLPVHRVRL